MGQKVSPRLFRIHPKLKKSDSQYFCSMRNLAKNVHDDYKVREYILGFYGRTAQISKIILEKTSSSNLSVNIHAGKPGLIIGRKGSDIDTIKSVVSKMVGISDVKINVSEVRNIDSEAKIVSDSIAIQLEKRVFFRRAMKLAMENSLRSGAVGIRVSCSGRLGGAEIARTEWYKKGRVPLHTIKADVDYSLSEAKTVYGIIGVKVWIYRASRVRKNRLNNMYFKNVINS